MGNGLCFFLFLLEIRCNVQWLNENLRKLEFYGLWKLINYGKGQYTRFSCTLRYLSSFGDESHLSLPYIWIWRYNLWVNFELFLHVCYIAKKVINCFSKQLLYMGVWLRQSIIMIIMDCGLLFNLNVSHSSITFTFRKKKKEAFSIIWLLFYSDCLEMQNTLILVQFPFFLHLCFYNFLRIISCTTTIL